MIRTCCREDAVQAEPCVMHLSRMRIPSLACLRALRHQLWIAYGFRCGTLLLMFAVHCSAADEPPFRFSKSISALKEADETLVSVPLDSDVYEDVRADLADIRVFAPDGSALPFIIRQVPELKTREVQRKTWNASTTELKPLDSGGLAITMLLADDDPQPSGLRIVTSLRNFEHRARVFASSDGNEWASVGEAVVFDYSRFMDVRNDSIPFPASPNRHVRLVIDDVTTEQESELMELTRRLRGSGETERVEKVTIDRRPFRIDRIEFWHEIEQVKTHQKRSYPVVDFKIAEDAEKHQTIVTIDTRREPLTSLVLQTKSRNFSRNGTVEILEQQGVKSTWRAIGNASLSQMKFKNFQREQLAVAFPESRQSQYRLVIDNRDSPPLEISGIQAEGNSYEIVFLAMPAQACRLAYGNPEATAPSYDTAALHTLLKERFQPEPLALGEEQKSTAPAPVGGFQWSRLLNDARLLTGIISLLVIVLGWGLYSAVRRIEDPPDKS